MSTYIIIFPGDKITDNEIDISNYRSAVSGGVMKKNLHIVASDKEKILTERRSDICQKIILHTVIILTLLRAYIITDLCVPLKKRLREKSNSTENAVNTVYTAKFSIKKLKKRQAGISTYISPTKSKRGKDQTTVKSLPLDSSKTAVEVKIVKKITKTRIG